MSAAIESLDQKKDSAAALWDVRRRDSWAEALAGVGPVLIFGLAMALMEPVWTLVQRALGTALPSWVPLGCLGAGYMIL